MSGPSEKAYAVAASALDTGIRGNPDMGGPSHQSKRLAQRTIDAAYPIIREDVIHEARADQTRRIVEWLRRTGDEEELAYAYAIEREFGRPKPEWTQDDTLEGKGS